MDGDAAASPGAVVEVDAKAEIASLDLHSSTRDRRRVRKLQLEGAFGVPSGANLTYLGPAPSTRRSSNPLHDGVTVGQHRDRMGGEALVAVSVDLSHRH
jgi:hypothetical protein